VVGLKNRNEGGKRERKGMRAERMDLWIEEKRG